MIGRVGGMMASAALSLTACTGTEPVPRDEIPFAPNYVSTTATALDADLVQIEVAMRGARDQIDVTEFADCVMAGYADARGFGFARHLRTQVSEEAGLWRADAIYTMSPDLPEGSLTIDVREKSNACLNQGIAQLVRANG